MRDSVHLDFSRGYKLAALRLDPTHRCVMYFVWPPRRFGIVVGFFFLFLFNLVAKIFKNTQSLDGLILKQQP